MAGWHILVSGNPSRVTDHSIHDATDALDRLGDGEVKCHCKVRSVKTVPAKEKKKGGPGQVRTWTSCRATGGRWTDLLAAG